MSENGVPKVILTVGKAFKPALGELYKKHSVCAKIRPFKMQNRIFCGYPSPGGEGTPFPKGGTPSHTRPQNSL